MGNGEVVFDLGGDGLHEHLEAFVALDDVASGGGEFEGVGWEIDLADNAAAEFVGEVVVVLQAEEVGLADAFASDADDEAGFLSGQGLVGDGVGDGGGVAVGEGDGLLELFALDVVMEDALAIDEDGEVRLASVVESEEFF